MGQRGLFASHAGEQRRTKPQKAEIGLVGGGIAEAAERAAREMFTRIKKALPAARLEGFTLQPMIRRRNARELILGVSEDETFGPVILFGAGGTAVEGIRDHAVALPPLAVLRACSRTLTGPW